MPNTLFHFILSFLIYKKIIKRREGLFFVISSTLIPDLDILASFLISFKPFLYHGTITHSIFFAWFFGVVFALPFFFKEKNRKIILFSILGVYFHLLTDFLQSLMLFYPLDRNYYGLYIISSNYFIQATQTAILLLISLALLNKDVFSSPYEAKSKDS